MNTRLHQIQNWPELAQAVGWSAAALAKKCGVSVRTRQRHFRKHMGKSPKAWITEQRRRRAVELLRDGSSVKETATSLGDKHAISVAREFVKQSGHYPTGHLPPNGPARAGNVA